MQQLARALALAFAVVIAHASTLLPHPSHVKAAQPPPAPPARGAGVAMHRTVIDGVRLVAAVKPAPAVPAAAPQRPAYSPPPLRYSGNIASIIQQAFAPLGQSAVTWAERVAMCESGDNPNARNPSGASGLFQIMPGTWAGTPYASQSPFNPVANARAAAWIYARRGASPWTCG